MLLASSGSVLMVKLWAHSATAVKFPKQQICYMDCLKLNGTG